MPNPTHSDHESQINLNIIHVGLKDYTFRYAEMRDIDKIAAGEESIPLHQIMCKKKGRGHRWQILGTGSSPLTYPSKEAAQADVRKLKKWASE